MIEADSRRHFGRTVGGLIAAGLLLIASSEARARDDAILSAFVNDDTVLITALAENIIRVRIHPEGRMVENASWAVPAGVRAQSVGTVEGDTLSTAQLRAKLNPATGHLTVTDVAGAVLVEDDAQPWVREAKGWLLRKRLKLGEHIYGLGDKTGQLDRRGGNFVNWNTDSYGFGPATDPIYKSIPFYIARGEGGRAYGIFVDATWRSWFDFGRRDPDLIEIGASGGAIDYYVLAGGSVGDVVRSYVALTGNAPLQPRWMFGYQQSRYSYKTDEEVREVAQRLRRERIPADVIWLDIDYQDRNRPFTVDRATFPDLPGLIRDLGSDGFKVVTIVDLHIAQAPDQGYAPYDSGAIGGHFLRRADGATYVAPVWPGPSVFPDFTRKATRTWWGDLYRPFLDMGIAGIWNDMNEPAIFQTPTKTMPLDNLHRVEGDDFLSRDATHAEIHNVYGMENSRATYEGLRRLRPDERAVVMTRASYAGGQRYAITWTGDNSATWEHLKLSVQQVINLGLSGFAYSGADVGGFTGGPTADLLTRWYQFGAFLPIFRNHATKGSPNAEPWADGPDHLAIRRRYIEERYRLLPYIYGLAAQNARTGEPIVRPLFYDHPQWAEKGCDASMTFALGRDLVVAGNPRPEANGPYSACLPAGTWYDYWTGEKLVSDGSGGKATRVAPRIEDIPVFVRAGAILPRQPLVQTTSQRPSGTLILDTYPGTDCVGVIYDDDGHTMAFKKDGFFRQTIRCELRDGKVARIIISPAEGHYQPWWRELSIIIHGPAPDVARLGRRKVSATRRHGKSMFAVTGCAKGCALELIDKAGVRRRRNEGE